MNAPTDSTALATISDSNVVAGYGNAASFDLLQRGAKALASAEIVPTQFRGKIADCMIALEIAQRLGSSPLLVMQNLYVVHGRPAWSGQFAIASANSTKRFSALRFEFVGERGSDDWGCFAWAVERDTDERLEGTTVTIGMARAEGWFKNSKWENMPEQMLRYRAGSWWVRQYAPEVMMGLQTVEEAHDIIDITPDTTSGLDALANAPDVDGVVEDTPTPPAADDKPPKCKPAKVKPVAKKDKEPAADGEQPAVTYAQVDDALRKAKSVDELNNAAATIDMVEDEQQQKELRELATELGHKG